MFNRRQFFALGSTSLFLVFFFLFGTPFADTALTANEIQNPDSFVWTYVASPEPHYFGVLEYGEATFTINGETLTTRAYRQEGGEYTIPGPTLNMVPGNKYVLRFRNLLPYETPSAEHNVFKDPNATNVHTHGLHISGMSPGDDVTRMFEGGFGGDYVYDIPADHMGGTFWYHAHHHGSTYLQVSTGGFGLIIIDDSKDQIPQSVADMQERHVLIGYLDPGVAGTGGDTIVSGTLQPGWTVNGERNGTLVMPPNTWQHWRVLLADRDAKTKDVTIGANCEVMLLARDGVWRTTAPKDLPARTVNLTGASRADLAVRCSANSTLNVANGTVANIVVAGTPDSGPSPYDNGNDWSALRPGYLRDLRGETSLNLERINMGARAVNGSKFDINVPAFSVTADQVQEWEIKGAVNHPFHLHVYHFQAQDGCGGDFEPGEYYDTLAGSCAVRFDLNEATSSPYSGRTIMHCHILEHEDQGAMTWVNVIGGTGAPTFPDGYGYAEKFPLAGGSPPNAPGNLTAIAISSSEIDLAWSDNSTDETGFSIERSLDGSSFSLLTTLTAGTTSYSDSGLTAGQTYWYRVFAENANGPSGYSNTAFASPASPPIAPGNLTATAISSSEIDLAWSDHSSDETGFGIERSLDGSNFSLLTTVAAGTTTYSDTGLTAGQTYWYRVSAYNGSLSSGYSNTASATTEPAGDPTSVTLGSLTVTLVNLNKGFKAGLATVLVVDDLGNPVQGATVSGDFSGAFTEPGTGVTGADGIATIQTIGSAKGSLSVTFCVTSITAPGLNAWIPDPNACSSSG